MRLNVFCGQKKSEKSSSSLIPNLFLYVNNIAPIGKPELMVAHNTSSSSIYLSWMPPKPETIFGEFLGYRITYRTRDVKPENANEVWLRENTVEVSVKVRNHV
jgi:hypothetical protein